MQLEAYYIYGGDFRLSIWLFEANQRGPPSVFFGAASHIAHLPNTTARTTNAPEGKIVHTRKLIFLTYFKIQTRTDHFWGIVVVCYSYRWMRHAAQVATRPQADYNLTLITPRRTCCIHALTCRQGTAASQKLPTMNLACGGARLRGKKSG